MSSYRESLESYLRTLDIKAKKVLDVGGGANPISERVKTWSVDEYRILDNEQEEMKVKPDFDFDINYEPTSGKRKQIGKYDLVVCLEVFEYVFDPIIALSNIARFMEDGGEAIVTFQTLYPLHNPEGTDYLRYTRESVEKLADEVGLSIKEIIPRFPTDFGITLLSNFYSQEGFHARKNTNDIFALGYIVRFQK